MQLTSVEITNIRAVDYIKFSAGALTLISAGNEMDKTSIPDGVKSVFAGGHDPSLLRQGSKKGLVLLTMDDGTTIEKAITPKGSTLIVKTSDGQVVPAPATFVSQLAKGFAFDPLAFINAPKAERAKYLASAMPISVSRRDILSAVDLKPQVRNVQALFDEMDDGLTFDLPTLLSLRKRIYDDRATTSKQRKTQESGIDALRKTLPGNWKPEGDPDQIVNDAQATVAEAEQELQQACDALDKEELAIAGRTNDSLAEVSKWETDEIDKIRVIAAKRKDDLRIKMQDDVLKLRENAADDIAAKRETVQTAKTQLSHARETAKGWAVQAQTAATIKQYGEDLRKTSDREDILTACIQAIDTAKERAMENTPIPELLTMDGEVFIRKAGLAEPIPFDSENTQNQYMLALKIASLGAGSLGLMCVDGAEAIVGENFEAFKRACVDSGFQVIATRAEAGLKDLEIETIEPVNA